MKKVLLFTILFLSSFFFFNLKDVNAAPIYKTLKDDNFSLINEDFIKFRNQVIEFCGDLKKYVIYYDSNNYKAVIGEENSFSDSYYYGLNQDGWTYFNNTDIYIYQDKTLTFVSSITSQTSIYFYISSKLVFLDTNIPSFPVKSAHYIVIQYENDIANTTEYLYNSTASLYSIYLKHFPPLEPEDPYEEEKILLSSFYVCVIEKISYLTNVFVTNYVFLTILGVFILIYVIVLFRRLLI